MNINIETPSKQPPAPNPERPKDSSYSRVPRNWTTSLEFSDQTTGFHQGPRQRRSGAKLILWSFAAVSVDSCLVVGLGAIFLASFLAVVKSQWGVMSGQGNNFLFIAGLSVLGTLAFSYMIMLRSFLGFTLGEWACGLRLGSSQQRSSRFYTLRVLLRSSLLFGTGIFVLPILSLIFGCDIPGKISGLSLFSLR